MRAWLLLFACALAGAQEKPLPSKLLQALAWREVGPYRGGRVTAVAGVPGDPRTYYFGATGGGVWKSTDGGWTWHPVSDGFFGGSIGAVAVSPSQPEILYVGGGEDTVRGNVSHGSGVWKSTDSGRTWRFAGLPNSRHIPRLRIHPRDPNRVYAAVLGHLFGANPERGVYRTTDGGKTWKRVLFVNADTGAIDLALDPHAPDTLYAAFWQVRRTPWTLVSGGPHGGLFKTTDGGETWTSLHCNPGFPAPPLGRIGVAVSPAAPGRVYAIVEAKEGGVYRSDDGGKTWRRVNRERKLRQRAWYYSRIYADPKDPDTVYVLNVRFWRSRDGGKTFQAVPTPHGDNHDLWIAPEDPRRMIEGNDGGANVTRDGGRTWTPQSNQPTAQIYRVSVDTAFPYRLLGAQQDNTALRIRAWSLTSPGIGLRDWEPTAGGESGHIVAQPDNPEIVFGGSYLGYLQRVDHATGDRRNVSPWPESTLGWGAEAARYRFNWNFPLFFSPHDPRTLYCAANVLLRSTDGGHTWKAVSPDLTRADPEKLKPSGGPVTKDNTSVEYYGTIFAAVESPLVKGLLWCGSDDGLIHVSRDGGRTWQNVTPPDMPPWTQVNSLEASPFEPGELYVAANRYKLDDFRPYLWKTEDYGRTWKRLDAGLPQNTFTRVVRADPERRGLLYCGTETGVFFSLDDGRSWQSLQQNLPVVPVTDLAVHARDLIAATQGRGFWILDDLSVLHQVNAADAAAAVRLYTPRPAVRVFWPRRAKPPGMGTNPPPGVWFFYSLAKAPAEDLVLEILDEQGKLIRRFHKKAKGKKDRREPYVLEAKAGLNRFVWDMRYPPAEDFPGLVMWYRNLRGPRALPGRYRARLRLGVHTEEVSFRILPDPRRQVGRQELEAQLSFLLAVRDKLSAVHRAVRRLRAVRRRLHTVAELWPLKEPLRKEAERIRHELTRIEEALYQTRNESRQDPLNFPIQLNDKLGALLAAASQGDHRPTRAMEAVRAKLFAAADRLLGRLETLLQEDVPALEKKIREQGLPVVGPKARP